jgi:hypothetical protein
MIIQCPNCGFSGRIPKYAVAVPHHARCLRCRHQFELSSLLPGKPQEDLPVPSPEAAAGESDTAHGGDPGSSSYELKAITEDLATATEASEGGDPWGDQEDEVLLGGDARSFPKVAGIPAPAPGITPLPRLHLASGLVHGAKDPWYSRVLQAWGIFFLIWALVILGRSVHSLLTAADFTTGGREILSSVVSILLLVPGSAGLFLLVDLGRYIRGLSRQSPEAEDVADEPFGEPATPLRTWPVEPRTLPAVRAANGH